MARRVAEWTGGEWWVYGLLGLLALLLFLVPSLLALIWIERKVFGRLQVRYGPNRAGPFGLLQPVADAIKVMTKEDVAPARGDRLLFRLAPALAFMPAMAIFAAIPFTRNMAVNLDIGVLYIIAVGSLGVIAVFMAGWASNNKYSLLGAMRAVAQTVSYELPLVLSVLAIVLATGSLSLVKIVEYQTVPLLLLQPLTFFIFVVAALAELNRTPFDIMEADSEIVAGYHTEYSGMSFSLFYLAEYTHALAVSALIATMFLGGWKPDVGIPWLWLIVKIYLVFLVFSWIRGTLPRLRVDQLMGFAWKFLFPLALINILIVAIEVQALEGFPGWLALVNIPVAAIILIGMARLFRFGRVTAPARAPERG
ncbi:MAG: NADH-quinone oxidoreductase subunit NuoH [Chloroflexi bacterium]|nr:NADH-quinone oxidoreductase subunit NuoH [Chloroflexota bacterium]